MLIGQNRQINKLLFALLTEHNHALEREEEQVLKSGEKDLVVMVRNCEPEREGETEREREREEIEGERKNVCWRVSWDKWCNKRIIQTSIFELKQCHKVNFQHYH